MFINIKLKLINHNFIFLDEKKNVMELKDDYIRDGRKDIALIQRVIDLDILIQKFFLNILN